MAKRKRGKALGSVESDSKKGRGERGKIESKADDVIASKQREEAVAKCSKSNPHLRDVKSRAVFVLENASLTKGFVHKKKKILRCNEDGNSLLRQGKNPNDYQPDIVFEALRAILDSKLNKAGMVGAIYVKTDAGLLLEVKPNVRIPRTCKRFCGVVVDVLEKSCIRSKDTGDVLIRVVEGPVTRYLPENACITGLSYSSQKSVQIKDYVSGISDDFNPVFVVGAMVNGKVSEEYTNDYVSISDYPLSAKFCLGMICHALEQKWSIF
ncbi:unnamed protein product [Linum trigynum]|uniref:Ribosomal RNA small subunit methyltransferase NEP1 n=1 Tax=Linum trigynum TaxID=586398 RepID=A0AAV2DJS3_9ROSI